MLTLLPPPPPPPLSVSLWRALKGIPSKPANRWQPSADSVVLKKAMPSFKAVAAETDATNMADSTVVADAAKVVDEGTSKKIPEKRKSKNRQKALAAEIDATHMADPTWVADATKVSDEGTRKQIPAKRKSTNSQKGDIVEARSKKKSKQKLVSSLPSSGHPLAVARDCDAPNMALATSVVDALVVTPEGRSKGMGEKSKSQKVNQVDAAGARRLGKCKKREVSPLVTLGETDAQ